ncbi:MAG: hypothetical protein Ta2G_06650 [Termitinemataceae bacterium]|nr:MAG: hypothetical protein Ta2G_06650 [Termitinemataceae bacterium]
MRKTTENYWSKKKAIFLVLLEWFTIGLLPAQTAGEQMQKFQTQFKVDIQKIVDFAAKNGKDYKLTVPDFEKLLKAQNISGKKALESLNSAEPGKLHWFVITAIYKGYDKVNAKLLLEDISEKTKAEKTQEALISSLYGVDASIFVLNDVEEEPAKVKEPNTIATFMCYGVHFATYGESGSQLYLLGIGSENIKPLFNSSNFAMKSGVHFIKVEDAQQQTQANAMTNFFLGGGQQGNAETDVFDPVKYPLVDLMDARAAMDKKKHSNEYSLPTVRVKYVSEVIFKGQSGTVVTVSTPDGILTEKMNFTGRATNVKNGSKAKVYYTIAKDPGEIWDIQAIEKL